MVDSKFQQTMTLWNGYIKIYIIIIIIAIIIVVHNDIEYTPRGAMYIDARTW